LSLLENFIETFEVSLRKLIVICVRRPLSEELLCGDNRSIGGLVKELFAKLLHLLLDEEARILADASGLLFSLRDDAITLRLARLDHLAADLNHLVIELLQPIRGSEVAPLGLGTKPPGFLELFFDLGTTGCEGWISLLSNDPDEQANQDYEVDERALELSTRKQRPQVEIAGLAPVA
jgi:hypothetical protein